jgi:two-component system, NarL family, response regulator LiaR
VVETGSSLPVISDVDIVLYDTFGQVHGHGIDLEHFVRDSGAKVVIYSWNLQPGLIERALTEGAFGYLSKVAQRPGDHGGPRAHHGRRDRDPGRRPRDES